MIATIARICEREKHVVVAEVLKNCTVAIEETGYDIWNGVTPYEIHLHVSPERYARISPQLESVEEVILAHARAVIRHNSNDHIIKVIVVPEVSMEPDGRERSYRLSTGDLRRDIESQRSLMMAVATGGPRIPDVEAEYQIRRTRIGEGLAERDLENPNPFDDLWGWYGKWSSGDLPTYQSRRQFVTDMYAPLLNKIRSEEVSRGSAREVEATGWVKVDRCVNEARERLASATKEEQFQTVGLMCRETLISLAETVFDPEAHPTLDGVSASKTDAKRMLEAYVATILSGGANEISRRHARAALDLANQLQHDRTANFRDAAICVEATTSVVNLIAIISGRRNP